VPGGRQNGLLAQNEEKKLQQNSPKSEKSASRGNRGEQQRSIRSLIGPQANERLEIKLDQRFHNSILSGVR